MNIKLDSASTAREMTSVDADQQLSVLQEQLVTTMIENEAISK